MRRRQTPHIQRPFCLIEGNIHSPAYLTESKYQRIARSFISYDHVYGHFVLPMHESGRVDSRAAVIQRIEQSCAVMGPKANS
jgi:hypothetical protein